LTGEARALRPSLRRADFARITGRGRRIVTPLFLVFILARSDALGARLGITVTRKVGNAVRRNRIKRLVREWFRQRRPGLGPCDIVVIAKRDLLGPCDIVVIAKRDLPQQLGLSQVGPDLDRALGLASPSD
jgi:ribonuclease P protein component